MIHPADAQEAIDDARAEAERAAEIALADLRATHDDELHDLRAALDKANAENLTLRQLLADARIDRVRQSEDLAKTHDELHRLRMEMLTPIGAELEPLRPLMDALHLELSRRGGDRVEYLPEVPGHSPAMLRLGRVLLSGMSAGALLEPLRDAALDFTQDCED